jgi:hypothetical protein
MDVEALGAWVRRTPLLCLTFARGGTWPDMLTALGLDPTGATVRTEDEAIPALNGEAVRTGTVDGWAFAVEGMSILGSDPDVLSRLSAEGGEAINLCWTPAIDTFHYCADGRYLNGFDLIALSCRWGSDPDRFEQQMHDAGFFAQRPGDTVTTALRFVHDTFGVSLDPDTLSGPLPTVALPH